MTVTIQRRPFTVRDYSRMLETGILTEDDRVELIDGEVRLMSPIGPLHVAIVNRLTALLTRQLGDQAIVSVQNPIQLNDYSEPQPDLTVLAPRADFYSTALALPDDVLLVIEVADSSLEYDRDEKLPRYAASGIAEVWIIDVSSGSVEQYSAPRGDHYGTKQTHDGANQVVSVSLPALSVTVRRVMHG